AAFPLIGAPAALGDGIRRALAARDELEPLDPPPQSGVDIAPNRTIGRRQPHQTALRIPLHLPGFRPETLFLDTLFDDATGIVMAVKDQASTFDASRLALDLLAFLARGDLGQVLVRIIAEAAQ